MGNFFPEYLVAGNAAGPLLGLYIHDLVGLWVTPMGWGMMYFFVPIILRKPIWSHALSLVGFWGRSRSSIRSRGVHHFLGSPIPMFAQYSAVISTIAIEIVVTHRDHQLLHDLARLRGLAECAASRSAGSGPGALLYFVTCLQCAYQTTLSAFQKIIHFSDWVVGHAHLVMFGVFTFWIFGMLEHLWPQAHGQRVEERRPAALELLADQPRAGDHVPDAPPPPGWWRASWR